ncbi:MAG: UDP-N-acetylmuramate dehydrogenase [Bacteroidia bacterium]|nr:UDP-N-acetylmuramate dehydrogenase [Bacteroidia bacterium]
MISFSHNKILTDYNTFHLPVYCNHFCEINTVAEFSELLHQKIYNENERLILGGGSNLLFTSNYNGLVIKNNFKGIKIEKRDDQHVFVSVGAGENWHKFVLWCIENNFSGLENLSLIPGNVGASPMQNIGAYGVEIKDVFESLEAVDMLDGTVRNFSAAECEFGYRESVFKRKLKNRFLISSVVFRLSIIPNFNTSYGAIEQELEKAGVKELSIKAISDAVIRIRSSKLPDPNVIGNAGSFFKNPEVSSDKCASLKKEFPDLVSYPLENGNFKLAAGWLIEKAGLKGKRFGDAGVHTQQALVLVNYGNSSGAEIFDLSQKVLDAVNEKFGVILEREVNIIS